MDFGSEQNDNGKGFGIEVLHLGQWIQFGRGAEMNLGFGLGIGRGAHV